MVHYCEKIRNKIAIKYLSKSIQIIIKLNWLSSKILLWTVLIHRGKLTVFKMVFIFGANITLSFRFFSSFKVRVYSLILHHHLSGLLNLRNSSCKLLVSSNIDRGIVVKMSRVFVNHSIQKIVGSNRVSLLCFLDEWILEIVSLNCWSLLALFKNRASVHLS